ncbi:diaminopimelate decarboxylase [Candidatus Carsonella ruddii]|uniref:Diaminopimelate decarboxylase n=2 Tax=cellular organisms TaxID=131567 RepID=A0AAJ6FDI6_CARRU|nr:diaminopimelate decarboxylase [Candidatus Carsonella ruddii]WGS66663.1 diaminopimelate decarboxylase [Candidatus Carsonella ruddii]WGS66859.1 diaminopimelate decarboxylase [Candidatus Carsonella ruddii]WGS67051.1 diaminopimelate decarboxylase [Candidatus Carsonella ruddii]WGS67243.1 diaminopimelate decarboxylase [Candidatus Carsonella ruddii]WMC18260.1 MAG: diaminopimelate decarboxylase [Candidatus Carsonella ruddii]
MKEIKNSIFLDKINIKKINKNFNLPLYIYNYKKIILNFFYIKKLKFFCFFSIKSNDNIFLLKLINKVFFKFDIVSIGELKKIILISKKKPFIVFSGSGKSVSEFLISLNLGLFSINIESIQEIFKIYYLIKKYKKNIKIMIRINPNINAKTHKKITTGTKKNKFGINIFNLKNLYYLNLILDINIIGYDFHIGSQITKISPLKKLLKLINILYKNKKYSYLDIGGGIGVDYYFNKKIINFSKYYNEIKKLIKKYSIKSKIIIELGRYMFCNCCVIISKINYIKYNEKNFFCILNLGMNDILRPSLYNSFHKIESYNKGKNTSFFFGPICESSDKFLSKKIKVKNNFLVIFYSTGSYCKTMSNNYNSKNKIFEIIVYKNKLKVIFKLEKFKNLIKNYV